MSSEPVALPRRVAGSLSEGARDLRRAWVPSWTVATIAWLVLLLLPLFADGELEGRLAILGYLAVAAVGLNIAAGLAAMPSIGHGAFIAIGALVVTVLRHNAGWPSWVATPTAVAAAAFAGLLVGASALRLRPAYVAISSWVGAWLMAEALDAFPSLSGGTRGVPLEPPSLRIGALGIDATATPGIHYVIALLLLTVTLLVFASIRGGALGLSLAAWRENRRAATAIGLGGPGPRVQAFVLSAAAAGVAGACVVQLAGVFDASSYGPILSVTLFVAVLLGGFGSTFGPVAGIAIVSLVSSTGLSTVTLSPGIARFGQIFVGALLLGAVVLSRKRLIRERETRDRPSERTRSTEVPIQPTILRAEGLTKRYGGVGALSGVDIELATGEIHAIVGPNGSGKTTLLRALAGDLELDTGRVTLGGSDISRLDVQSRVRAGLVRTLQITAVFPNLTAQRHGEAALLPQRDEPGFWRDVLKTPSARARASALRSDAGGALEKAGVSSDAGIAAELSASDQRFLMIGMAAAGRPSFLLLDEPSAGMSATDKERLKSLLRGFASEGAGVVVVEHDLRLLRALADVVTVLDTGHVIATGKPDAVLRDPAVIAAYLGVLSPHSG